MKVTAKQREIMGTIIAGNPDGTFLDIDQLLEALPYRTTKQSLQFSIRALVKHGMLTKAQGEYRRTRIRTVLVPTGLAYFTFGGQTLVPEDEGKALRPLN